MDMYNLRQIPSEVKIRKYLCHANFGSRNLAYDLIYQASPGRLQANSFLFQKVQPGAQLWTDGASIYKQAGEYWLVTHTADIHKKFERRLGSFRTTFANSASDFPRRSYLNHRSYTARKR